MTDLPIKTNLLNQPLTLPNGFVIPNRLAIVTCGFRSVEEMNQALESNAFDVVGIARLMAIDPNASK